MFSRVRPAGALLALALLAAGCGDEEVLGRAEAYLTVDPAAVDFDDVAVGTIKTLDVELNNPGSALLKLQAALDDTLSGEVSLAEVPESLPPGTRRTIRLTFAPTSPGVREGNLTFTTDSGSTPTVVVTVRGRGVNPALVADPPMVDFGRVLVGTTATQAVSLTNSSDRAVEVIRASLTQATSLEYSVTLDRIRLDPGASIDLVVTYSPNDVGMDEGAVTVLDSGPRAMDLTIRLRGQGVESDIVVEPNALAFSGIYPGQTQTLPFFVRNIGVDPHQITKMVFASSNGAVAGDLSFAPNATPIDVPAGDAVQVDVTFTPQSTGMVFDEIRVDATGQRNTAVVSVTAVVEPAPVARIEVAPPSLNFGQVEVGMTSQRNLQISNTGTADLTLTQNITIVPAGAPYTLSNAPASGTVMAPTDSSTFQVTFAPITAGVAPAAELVVTSDDPNTPVVRVPLVGEGVVNQVPNIFVDPNPLAFGQVPRGIRASRSVLVRNDGTAPLILNLVRLTDNAGGRFGLPTPPAPGTSLAPGQQLNFSVEYFDNGVVAAYAGMMEIQSNDPGGAEQVPLTASTEPPPVALTDINIQLTWSRTNADVDIHLIRPGGSFFDAPSDACFCNSNPDWGMPGNATDNPFLDRDDLVGPGPETINLTTAENGEYQVVVHFYADTAPTPAPVDATVEINIRGTTVATVTRALNGSERWIAGYITWNAATQMGTFRPSILGPFPTILLLCF
ncbi:MAG: choice-of-anchor D domain-containing protein [Myxococcales bacterium]|nr:choice-of-anchor D domain-containing protein [Myxococcales bacterium]